MFPFDDVIMEFEVQSMLHFDDRDAVCNMVSHRTVL